MPLTSPLRPSGQSREVNIKRVASSEHLLNRDNAPCLTFPFDRPIAQPAMSAAAAFQFVHITKPADAANHRRHVRSHAARNSKARRERVTQYQSQLRQADSRRKPKPPSSLSESSSSESPSETSSSSSGSHSTVQTPATSVHADPDWESDRPWPLIPIRPVRRRSPSPMSLLNPARQDPFDSFSQPLSPFEGFLLNHCTTGHLTQLVFLQTFLWFGVHVLRADE